MYPIIASSISRADNSFISTWKTDNVSLGSSASNQIALPLEPNGTYNFIVEWGDGTTNRITSYNQPEAIHTYSIVGTYILKITGICIGWHFRYSASDSSGRDRLKILSIQRWGCLRLVNLNAGQYFYKCENLSLTDVGDTLNLIDVNSLESAFRSCTSLTTVNHMHEWDLSGVTSIYGMFIACTNFNQNINSWNVSNVVSFGPLFQNCSNFNQPVNNWDTNKVANMNSTFYGCTNFNQELSNWDTSNVTNMGGMFYMCKSFNKPLNTWNTGKVSLVGQMFNGAILFNQDLDQWNTSKFNGLSQTFSGCTAFNGNIDNWNVNKATTLFQTFLDCPSFNRDLSNWDVTNVTNMNAMFVRATNFDQNIANWDISKVTDFAGFMSGKTAANYSAANYDALLIAWSLLSVQPNININFGTIKYTAAAAIAKSVLTSAPNNWTIVDGGDGTSTVEAINAIADTNEFNKPSSEVQGQIVVMIDSLIAAGIWNKLDYFTLYAYNQLGLENYSKINFIKPTSTLATFFGGLLFSEQGINGNGSNAFISTGFNARNGINYQLYNACMGAFVFQGDLSTVNKTIWAISAKAEQSLFNIDSDRHRINSLDQDAHLNLSADLSGLGLKMINRDDSINVRVINKDVEYARTQVCANTVINNVAYLFRQQGGGYGRSGIGVAFQGASLTYEESQTFRTIFNTYLTNIGLTPYA